MVADHYADKWRQGHPFYPNGGTWPVLAEVSRAEFDALKRDVEEMKALLKRAKEYDERTGQPDCEMDEKVALLRKVADMVGVNLDDVLGHE
jgi:hypothetical protein